MQKIFVEKNEIIAEVIERILETSDPEITLVIPKRSQLNESGSNFSLLAREAKALAKHIVIESVDEETLSFARAHKLEAIHPLFSEGERAISDILPRESGKKKTVGVRLKVYAEEVPERPVQSPSEDVSDQGMEGSELEVEDAGYENAPTRRKVRPGIFIAVFAVLVAVGASVWVVGAYFGKAEATIRFKQTPWEYRGTFTAGATVSKTNSERNLIPAQLFEDTKNWPSTESFPATGRSNVSEKARGKITIYNAYSSAPQTLVKTTRFETPDGKIFRLESQVIVPGAKITDGKIEPASIKATVIADKAGSEFNLDPVPKLTIPGLKGSPKFTGFYGSFEEGTAGGAIGDRPVPTEDDIAKAKAKVSEILLGAFKATFLGTIPQDMKVIDGATSFEITKLTVNRTADADGNFSVIASASFKAMAFRESDILSVLESHVQDSYPGLSLKSQSLEYANAKVDFAKKELTFSLSVPAVLTPPLVAEVFAGEIAGKTSQEARSIIQKLPELGDAKLSLWPAWLNRLPEDKRRIMITVE